MGHKWPMAQDKSYQPTMVDVFEYKQEGEESGKAHVVLYPNPENSILCRTLSVSC
jgi:hypothetical protein